MGTQIEAVTNHCYLSLKQAKQQNLSSLRNAAAKHTHSEHSTNLSDEGTKLRSSNFRDEIRISCNCTAEQQFQPTYQSK